MVIRVLTWVGAAAALAVGVTAGVYLWRAVVNDEPPAIVLSALLVILTAFYAWFTWLIARRAERSALASERAIELSMTPAVEVDEFEYEVRPEPGLDRLMVKIRLRNVGAGAAVGVQWTVETVPDDSSSPVRPLLWEALSTPIPAGGTSPPDPGPGVIGPAHRELIFIDSTNSPEVIAAVEDHGSLALAAVVRYESLIGDRYELVVGSGGKRTRTKLDDEY